MKKTTMTKINDMINSSEIESTAKVIASGILDTTVSDIYVAVVNPKSFRVVVDMPTINSNQDYLKEKYSEFFNALLKELDIDVVCSITNDNSLTVYIR